MSQDAKPNKNISDSTPPLVRGQDLLIILLILVAVALFVINLLPQWLPALTSSVSGSQPKVFWFLSRGSAIAAYWLLWLSVAMGVSISNKCNARLFCPCSATALTTQQAAWVYWPPFSRTPATYPLM